MIRRMMNPGVTASALLLAVLLVGAGQATAQQKLMFDSEGGVAFPTSKLAKLTDAGPSFGIKVGYQVHPRIAFNIMGDVDVLNGAELTGVRAPDMRLWHYGAGLEAGLLPANVKRWSIRTNLGLGATTFDSDEFVTGPGSSVGDFSHTYFTTTGGVKLGYAVNRKLTTYVSGKAHWMATNREDTEVLAALDPSKAKTFNNAWTFPVTAGFNLKI